MAFLKRFGIGLIAVVMLAICIQNHLAGKDPSNFVASDGKGYYAYLPALFVYNDPSFGFIKQYETKYYGPESYFDFRNKTDDGKTVDKYFSGLAILWAPFFLLSHIIALLLHLPRDGYSLVYQLSVPAAMSFYLYLGLKALYKLLMALNARVVPAFLTIVFIVFATNLLYYAGMECSMTHVYSFSLICIFAYCLHKICINDKPVWILLSIMVLALIVAIRPVNIMVIGMLPVVAGSKEKISGFFKYSFSNIPYVAAGILIASIPFIIQMSLWHWQTGHWIVYAYKDEGFIWDRPVISRILFSYRKGWFIYTPLALAGVIGLVYWIKQDMFRAVAALLQLGMILYVVSCWWNWSYGMSFGQRAMVDFLILPALGIHTLLGINTTFRIGTSLLSALFVILNGIQIYQYNNFILLWDGMYENAYWKVFLKTDLKYKGILWGDLSESTKLYKGHIRASFLEDYENINRLGKDPTLENGIVHLGKNAVIVDQYHCYSPGLEIALKPCDSMLQATVWFYNRKCENSVLGSTIYRKGKVIAYNDSRFLLFWFKNKEWTQAVLHAKLPADVQEGDTLKVFVWNVEPKEKVIIDDLKADIMSTAGCR